MAGGDLVWDRADVGPTGGGGLPSRAPSPTRCVAHTRRYADGRLAEEGFDVSAVSDHLADPGNVLWVDLLQPDEGDMTVLVEELGLHPLAIEDALHAHQRPKLDRYADHSFLAVYAVVLEGEELVAAEVAAFVTVRALVTVRTDPRVELPPVLERWDAAGELAPSGVAFLAHGLLDVLVDGYTAVAEDLDDRADDLEELLFLERSSRPEVQRQTFALRRAIAALRRVVGPMREVVSTMRRPDVGLSDERMEPYLRDVADHLLRVSDACDALRDRLGAVLDTTIALQGQRLNETIFRLTAYAAILAVTTAVTGFFGQNVPFPGSGRASGFAASVVLLVTTVTGLVAFFRRKGWL